MDEKNDKFKKLANNIKTTKEEIEQKKEQINKLKSKDVSLYRIKSEREDLIYLEQDLFEQEQALRAEQINSIKNTIDTKRQNGEISEREYSYYLLDINRLNKINTEFGEMNEIKVDMELFENHQQKNSEQENEIEEKAKSNPEYKLKQNEISGEIKKFYNSFSLHQRENGKFSAEERKEKLNKFNQKIDAENFETEDIDKIFDEFYDMLGEKNPIDINKSNVLKNMSLEFAKKTMPKSDIKHISLIDDNSTKRALYQAYQIENPEDVEIYAIHRYNHTTLGQWTTGIKDDPMKDTEIGEQLGLYCFNKKTGKLDVLDNGTKPQCISKGGTLNLEKNGDVYGAVKSVDELATISFSGIELSFYTNEDGKLCIARNNKEIDTKTLEHMEEIRKSKERIEKLMSNYGNQEKSARTSARPNAENSRATRVNTQSGQTARVNTENSQAARVNTESSRATRVNTENSQTARNNTKNRPAARIPVEKLANNIKTTKEEIEHKKEQINKLKSKDVSLYRIKSEREDLIYLEQDLFEQEQSLRTEQINSIKNTIDTKRQNGEISEGEYRFYLLDISRLNKINTEFGEMNEIKFNSELLENHQQKNSEQENEIEEKAKSNPEYKLKQNGFSGKMKTFYSSFSLHQRENGKFSAEERKEKLNKFNQKIDAGNFETEDIDKIFDEFYDMLGEKNPIVINEKNNRIVDENNKESSQVARDNTVSEQVSIDNTDNRTAARRPEVERKIEGKSFVRNNTANKTVGPENKKIEFDKEAIEAEIRAAKTPDEMRRKILIYNVKVFLSQDRDAWEFMNKLGKEIPVEDKKNAQAAVEKEFREGEKGVESRRHRW
jgi:hypothetical protein